MLGDASKRTVAISLVISVSEVVPKVVGLEDQLLAGFGCGLRRITPFTEGMEEIESEAKFNALMSRLVCIFSLTDTRGNLKLQQFVFDPGEIVCCIPLKWTACST